MRSKFMECVWVAIAAAVAYFLLGGILTAQSNGKDPEFPNMFPPVPLFLLSPNSMDTAAFRARLLKAPDPDGTKYPTWIIYQTGERKYPVAIFKDEALAESYTNWRIKKLQDSLLESPRTWDYWTGLISRDYNNIAKFPVAPDWVLKRLEPPAGYPQYYVHGVSDPLSIKWVVLADAAGNLESVAAFKSYHDAFQYAHAMNTTIFVDEAFIPSLPRGELPWQFPRLIIDKQKLEYAGLRDSYVYAGTKVKARWLEYGVVRKDEVRTGPDRKPLEYPERVLMVPSRKTTDGKREEFIDGKWQPATKEREYPPEADPDPKPDVGK